MQNTKGKFKIQNSKFKIREFREFREIKESSRGVANLSSLNSHLSSQRTLPPPAGTPSTLEGEFLYSSSSKLEEVSRSDGGVCLEHTRHSIFSHHQPSAII